jgi:hypothetical protein
MSLERCPLQEQCPDFHWRHKSNGESELKDNWHRVHQV